MCAYATCTAATVASARRRAVAVDIARWSVEVRVTRFARRPAKPFVAQTLPKRIAVTTSAARLVRTAPRCTVRPKVIRVALVAERAIVVLVAVASARLRVAAPVAAARGARVAKRPAGAAVISGLADATICPDEVSAALAQSVVPAPAVSATYSEECRCHEWTKDRVN